MKAPFPYFGGKRSVAENVWKRLGRPTQYIEPFCGSAAILLAAPRPAALEVVCDASGFIANFWRATKHQPAIVAEWADYPVSHIDLGARHRWIIEQRERVGAALQDPDWPGDAKVAGWWLWGQCCWIGSGWCEWERAGPARRQRREGDTGGREGFGATSAGRGIQAVGRIPHATSAGMGIQAVGKVPNVGDAGRGIQAVGQVPHATDAGMGENRLLTSCGRTAWTWLHRLANRLERVRVVHGDWSRCLNNHYGGNDTAVFLDPPYRTFEKLYGGAAPVADAVEAWARENAHLRVALCGHRGDYPSLTGWDAVEWSRGPLTYGGGKTTDEECIWYSPGCLPVEQPGLFSESTA